MEKKISAKPLRSCRISCESKENVSPRAKNVEIVTKKPIRTAFTCAKRILLRSSKRRATSILKKNVFTNERNETIFDDDKIKIVKKNEKNVHSVLKDIATKSKPDTESMDYDNANERREKISDSPSIMEDVSISQRNEGEDNGNDQIISDVNKTTKDLSSINETPIIDSLSESFHLIRNANSAEIYCHKRKSRELLKNECDNEQPTQNNNDHQSLSEAIAEMTKTDHPKLDEVSLEEVKSKECEIPSDINMNVPSEDLTTVIETTEELCRKDNDELGNKENEVESDFPKISPTIENQNNDVQLFGQSDSKDEIHRSNFQGKYSQYLERGVQEDADETPRWKLRHINAQTMPVFERKIAVSKSETLIQMEDVILSETVEKCENSSCGRDKQELVKDSLSVNKESQIPSKNITAYKKIGTVMGSDYLNLVKMKNPSDRLLRIESVILPQEENENDDAKCRKNEQEEEDPLALKKESQIPLKNLSILRKTGRSKDSKYSEHPHTDSDETLSNVESIESIPGSPLAEILPKTSKNNSSMSKKNVTPHSERNNVCQKEVNSILQRLSADIRVTNITDRVTRDLRSTTMAMKLSKMKVSGTLSSSIIKQKSELQDSIKFSPNQNCSGSAGSSEKSTEEVDTQDNLGIQKTVSWLRHYERPRKTQTEMIKSIPEIVENEKESSVQKTKNSSRREKRNVTKLEKTSNAGDLPSENLQQKSKQGTGRYALKEKNKNLLNTNNQTNTRKRGRPPKQKNEQSNLNSNKKVKVQVDNANSQLNHHPNSPATDQPNTDRTVNRQVMNQTPAFNGSALTILELTHLLLKFDQHGHFRIVFEHDPNDSCHRYHTTRMQCYNQKEYYMPSNCNVDASNFEDIIHPHLQKSFQTDNNGNENHCSNNSSFGENGHRFSMMNPNLHNKFSSEFDRQMSHSRNASPCSTRVGHSCYENLGVGLTGSNDMNSRNYNSTIAANTNSLLSGMQSGYTEKSNYQQDFHNNYINNANAVDNDSYSNYYSDIKNLNDSMNNGNIGTVSGNILSSTNNITNDMSFGHSIQNQRQNLMPLGEMDATVSNGHSLSHSSTISMWNNSSMNDLNADWNLSGLNQQMDSTNELLMDRNTMSRNNDSNQAMDGITDTNNLTYDSNSNMNGSNLWTNRSNNTTNPGFSPLKPWHGSLPMYNPYLNNNNLHYENMFSPCGAFVGYNSSNYPFLNTGNNADPWMQNSFPTTEDGYFAMHVSSNAQFSGMGFGSHQANNFSFNDGMNLSLPSDTVGDTTIETTNINNPNGDNLNIGNGNELNSTIEQISKNSAALIKTNDNVQMQEISQISDPYSSEYRNCRQSLDSNSIDGGVINDVENVNQQQKNVLKIYDCVNQRLENFEGCFDENYTNIDSSNCKTVITQSNNGETELAKLRQELADFTKQYSEGRMSPDSTGKWNEPSNDDGKV